MQDGERTEVPDPQHLQLLTKPNAAVISADKCNVVYRGFLTPITILHSWFPDNNVSGIRLPA